MNLIEVLLGQQPPLVRSLVGAIQGMIPREASDQADQFFDALVHDVANGRDQAACDKLRAFLIGVGVNLDEYRDQHPTT